MYAVGGHVFDQKMKRKRVRFKLIEKKRVKKTVKFCLLVFYLLFSVDIFIEEASDKEKSDGREENSKLEHFGTEYGFLQRGTP